MSTTAADLRKLGFSTDKLRDRLKKKILRGLLGLGFDIRTFRLDEYQEVFTEAERKRAEQLTTIEESDEAGQLPFAVTVVFTKDLIENKVLLAVVLFHNFQLLFSGKFAVENMARLALFWLCLPQVPQIKGYRDIIEDVEALHRLTNTMLAVLGAKRESRFFECESVDQQTFSSRGAWIKHDCDAVTELDKLVHQSQAALICTANECAGRAADLHGEPESESDESDVDDAEDAAGGDGNSEDADEDAQDGADEDAVEDVQEDASSAPDVPLPKENMLGQTRRIKKPFTVFDSDDKLPLMTFDLQKYGHVQVGKSSLGGWGVFATEDFKPNDAITEYQGKWFDSASEKHDPYEITVKLREPLRAQKGRKAQKSIKAVLRGFRASDNYDSRYIAAMMNDASNSIKNDERKAKYSKRQKKHYNAELYTLSKNDEWPEMNNMPASFPKAANSFATPTSKKAELIKDRGIRLFARALTHIKKKDEILIDYGAKYWQSTAATKTTATKPTKTSATKTSKTTATKPTKTSATKPTKTTATKPTKTSKTAATKSTKTPALLPKPIQTATKTMPKSAVRPSRYEYDVNGVRILKNTTLNAKRYREQPDRHMPKGIVNDENLCFFNAVLQCLAAFLYKGEQEAMGENAMSVHGTAMWSVIQGLYNNDNAGSFSDWTAYMHLFALCVREIPDFRPSPDRPHDIHPQYTTHDPTGVVPWLVSECMGSNAPFVFTTKTTTEGRLPSSNKTVTSTHESGYQVVFSVDLDGVENDAAKLVHKMLAPVDVTWGRFDIPVANKTIRFSKLPEVLVVHLKRFTEDEKRNPMYVAQKLDYSNGLDLVGDEKAAVHYEPMAVIVFCGEDLRGGHYIARVFTDDDNGHGRWFTCNDAKVSLEQETLTEASEAVIGHEAQLTRRRAPTDPDNEATVRNYIVFYKQC